MTQGIRAPQGFIAVDGHRLSRRFSLFVPTAGALALSLLAGAWTLRERPAAAPEGAEARPTATSAPATYGALLVDLRFNARWASASLSQSAPPEPELQPAPPAPLAAAPEPENVQPVATASQLGEIAPMPPRRPIELGALASRGLYQGAMRQLAQQNRSAVAPTDNRSIFEKFFGGGESSAPQTSGTQAPGAALAYAATSETGLFGGLKGLGSGLGSGLGARSAAPSAAARYDRYTAIYDISAHTVYMPNGTKLEAHSGLRERLDDPRYVHERMRGPTPPHVYDLTPREQLFHGVQALRLIPVGGGGAIFGRAGLLAHTYMLGPKGDSNGCVSFRNYDAFLQAYKNGEVKRLVVVAHLD